MRKDPGRIRIPFLAQGQFAKMATQHEIRRIRLQPPLRHAIRIGPAVCAEKGRMQAYPQTVPPPLRSSALR